MEYPISPRILVFLLSSISVIATEWCACPGTELLPTSVFDNIANLEKYFTYGYPWGGTTHNGGARMDPAYVQISKPGTLTITAQHVSGQPSTTFGGKTIPINYLSGAIGARQHFNVPVSGGLVFTTQVQAPVAKGTWPAFWLTGVHTWPPEVDMAEWKGSGKISFNTFNTSSSAQTKDVPYPNPSAWHDIKVQLKDNGGSVVEVKYWLDGTEITTQYGKNYVGQALWLVINLQMEGSSGSPGPLTNTTYSLRNLEITTL